jgi:lipid-A-disaccharide synthase
MAEQRQKPGTIIGILPGSRTMEVQNNFHSQLRAAARIHEVRPDTRFLVACYKESQQKIAEEIRRSFASLPVQTVVKRTPEIIELSKMCMAVSGSVSLELLYRCKPTVIGYRTSKMLEYFIRPLITAKYITLVNLLADRVLFPEFATEKCEAPAIADALLHWLNDYRAYAKMCADLLSLREKTAQPGACSRAADRILGAAQQRVARAA